MNSDTKIVGESNPQLYQFRCNLLKVSQRLRDEEVKELAYICPEIKSTGDFAKGHILFLELEKKGLVYPGNYDYLLDRLLQIAREDLATFLIERVLHSPHTAHDISNAMLDRLLKTGREDVTLHFMEWMWKSSHTSSELCAHLNDRLISSGREDLATQLMVRTSCFYLPRGFQSDQQTMQIVCHAKQRMCRELTTALSMLSIPHSPINVQLNSMMTKYFLDVKQSASMDPGSTFTHWSDLPVCKASGSIDGIFSNTLESIFTFADAFRDIVAAFNKVENRDPGKIRQLAKTCNSTIDHFNKAHTPSGWNPGEREEVLHLRNTRKFPGAIHIQTACKSISSICEGIICRRAIQAAESATSDRLFTLETVIYAMWCSVPMVQWIRTIIQLAASSKLDLTRYRNTIIKVAANHREPIVRYHDGLSQIIGRDAMRNVDSVLQIRMEEVTTPTSGTAPTATHVQNSFDLESFMGVLWYAFLLQLVTLACDYFSNPRVLASKMGERHCSFGVDRRKDVIESSVATARNVITAIHTEVENFKEEVIQKCPESSAEKALLSGLLPIVWKN